MKEYAITFRRFKNNCGHVFPNQISGVKHICGKRISMDWVKSKDRKTYIKCSEVNCPVLKQCDEFEIR